MHFRNPRRTAFTLVELMVTLVILALLSGVVTIRVRAYLLSSKQNVAKLEISKIMQAVDTFYATNNRYPTNEEGVAVLVSKTDSFPEGILSFIPKDPWGNEYEYRSPGVEDEFEVICFGADKREGGEGGDKDITSMELNRSRK